MNNTFTKKVLIVSAIFGFVLMSVPFTYAAVAPVSNFSASLSGTTATVSWTTPNDGTLSQFDIRYSTSLISDGNFTLATQVAKVPQPLPGQTQSVQVPGISSGTYFAIKIATVFMEYSPIVTTSVSTDGGGGGGGGNGCTSPFSVMNFQASPVSSSLMNVLWQTPSQGDLSQFDVRYSTNPISEGNFYLATQVANVPQPLPGQVQSIEVSGLSASTLYYFGIKVTNICMASSPFVTTSATTLAGGGGGPTPPTPPGGGGGGSSNPTTLVSGQRVIINNGEEKTYVTGVTLTLTATGASQMKISNLADVSDASWQAYTDKKTWTLTDGDGIKTVYVKYRNSNNIETDVVSDDIRLGDEPTPQPEPQNPVNTTTTQIIYVPIAQPQVLGVNTYRAPLDFNTLMVNWGDNKAGNYADLTKDGKVNMDDVRTLMANWVNISSSDVYVSAIDATKFLVEPNKLTFVEGQEVMLVVDVVPGSREKNYTARLEMYYPTDVLEYKSFTYWTNWIPVVRPEYDVVDETRGRIVKTAGMPGGFDTKKTFAVMKFTAKKTGSGTISVQNSSYSLDSTNVDTFISPSDGKSTELNSVSVPSGAAYQLASLVSFGESGNLASFFATFIFFVVVYGIYLFWGRKKNEGEV